ncbi:MAG: helix-turn-helix transcriptional regulator [Actinomycetia bacterium]|nr:helix-turn-helix transcriptional regulator [Actinomycetes bacterium]
MQDNVEHAETKKGEDEHVIVGLLRAGAGDPDASCPVSRFLDTFDGPWATLIVRELLLGPKRFGELLAALGGISPKTLSARLKKLASYGVLTRDDRGGVPPKVVYELTRAGQSVAPVLFEMAMWAEEHLPSEAARPPRPRPTPRRADR